MMPFSSHALEKCQAQYPCVEYSVIDPGILHDSVLNVEVDG